MDDQAKRTGWRWGVPLVGLALVLSACAGSSRASTTAGTTATTAPAATSSSVALLGPGGGVVPTRAPAGLTLWNLSVATAAAVRADAGTSSVDREVRVQLFGRHGAPVLLLQITSGPTTLQYGDGATPQTIRGQAGLVDDRLDQAQWNDGAATITASFRNTAEPDIDLLDHLGEPGTEPTIGFTAPASSGLTLLATWTPSGGTSPTAGSGTSASIPSTPPPAVLQSPQWVDAVATPGPPTTGVVTDATYADGTDAATVVDVEACPAGGDCFPDLPSVWFAGTRLPDGSAEEVIPDQHEPTRLVRVWPSGGGAEVSEVSQENRNSAGQDTGIVDLTRARRLLSDLAPLDASALAARQAAVSAQLQALPQEATATVALGTVQMHGAGHLTATCVGAAGRPLHCDATTIGPVASMTAGVISQGHWLLAAADRAPDPAAGSAAEPVRLYAGGDRASRDTGAIEIPAETGSSDLGGQTWTLVVAQIPDDMSSVLIGLFETYGPEGTSVLRPAG